MDDALLVRRVERIGDLLRDRRRASSIGIAPRAIRCERSSPSTSSITSAVTPAVLFEPVDCGDVRMVQGREHFRFALKPCETIVISGNRGRQDLDRDLAFQLRVRCTIHLPHAAFADLRDDFVDAETRAGSEGQVAGLYGPDRKSHETLCQNCVRWPLPPQSDIVIWGDTLMHTGVAGSR